MGIKNIMQKGLMIPSKCPARLFHGCDFDDADSIERWLMTNNANALKNKNAYRNAACAWQTIMKAYGNHTWQHFLLQERPSANFLNSSLSFYSPDPLIPQALDSLVTTAGNGTHLYQLCQVINYARDNGCITDRFFRFLIMHRGLYASSVTGDRMPTQSFYDHAQLHRIDPTTDLPPQPVYF